ncbi:hypothetical protein INR79_23680 [Vibrio sp. SCSIO 43132]|uniref:hypothetical protein n=1 Tax=Vibrio sp. SCSIO 43132 TaxID=2779363 RepID=UPI001CA85458|nr:hypothetical protein [Vibrio sp. SCSIO 43132]UAB72264.1 hypothetical protein INR79_23680 [Vibrio sp. SCSIO 43132]
MIVNQHNNSARLGALSSAILASFLSFGVNANISTVSISPIVVNPFGESKQGICETYNARVKVANAQLRNLGLGEIESQNTCTHVPLSRGQIEVSLHPFKYNIYPTSYNTWAQMEEKVDITHELELIMLSGGGETHYVVYTTGGAQLREQHFYCIGTITPRICSNAPQYKTSDLKGNLVASWNAWGANQLNNVFNNVKTQIQTVDAKNNPSVPGGNGNSRYWRLDDYFPKTSTQNKTLDIAKSTSISFGVEGSTGKEASVNFAVGYESGFSTEETVMTVHGTELTSDTGSSSEFKLNAHAIWPLSSFNSEVSSGSSSLVDNRIGQSAWRDIDFSSFTIWRETVNQGNCNPDEGVRNQIFRHTLSMDRGQYDADHNSDVLTVVEGASYERSYASYSAAKNFSVGTKCVAGKSGKWYRVHETGTLNR